MFLIVFGSHLANHDTQPGIEILEVYSHISIYLKYASYGLNTFLFFVFITFESLKKKMKNEK